MVYSDDQIPQPGELWYEWYYAEFNIRLYKKIGLDEKYPRLYKMYEGTIELCLEEKAKGKEGDEKVPLLASRREAITEQEPCDLEIEDEVAIEVQNKLDEEYFIYEN